MNGTRSPVIGIVMSQLRRSALLLLAGAACMLGTIAMDLLAPWPLKLIIDHALLSRPLPASLQPLQPLFDSGTRTVLLAMAVTIATVAFLAGTFAYLQAYLTTRVGYRIAHQVRSAVFSRVVQLPLTFHARMRSGELLSRVTADTALLRDLLTDWTVRGTSEVLLIAGIVVIMGIMNWRLALIVLVALPLLFLAVRQLSRTVRQNARAQRRQEAQLSAQLSEVLASPELVQSLDQSAHESQRFSSQSLVASEAGMRSARISAAVSRTVSLAAALTTAATVYFGATQAVRGALTPGDLLIFVAYVAALFKPIRDLGKLWTKLARATAGTERLDELLMLDVPAVDTPDAVPLSTVHGDIVFDRVCFAYPGQPRVLDDCSLRIRAGECVALIGSSASGKSTLASLLQRLHEPDSGQILIDGLPLRRCTLASLRREVGLVLQQGMFIGETIRDNIAYGELTADDARIEAAARLAGAHQFISALPKGYASRIGERGCTLSGGQRQRLCLARTLLRDPAILVLDEPTSAVDAESATALEAAIVSARRGRTTIVIGHQFASFAPYDRVLRMEHGQITDVSEQLRASRRRSSAVEAVSS